jgi:hypothetical protein
VIYLPIFSFALARQVLTKDPGTLDFFNILAIIMLCIFFLGLYKLSRDFQDPYGLDFVDIPIVEICNQTVIESFRVAAVVHAQDVNKDSQENELDTEFPELGPGHWDTESLDDNANDDNAPGDVGKITFKMKREMKRQVAYLKKRSKAIPSFM